MIKEQTKAFLGFVTLWLLFGSAAGLFEHLGELPRGVHQGAQCDRASLAQNFYYGDMSLLYPEVNEDRCIDGIVSCEFPLGSYLAAGLYRIFGYDEFWFRLLSYGIFSLGMCAFFYLFRTRMAYLPALALVLLMQASPVLLFYCAGFLPDITSLGLAALAWYLFFRQHIRHPYLPAYRSVALRIVFVICLGLSVAVKTTSLLQWLSMAGVLFFSVIPRSGIRIIAPRKLLISLLLSISLPLAWFFWSRHLGQTHNSQYFMMGLPPLDSWENYRSAWAVYLANWPAQTLSYPLIQISLGLLLLSILLKRSIQRELWLLSLLNSLGSIAFLFLMMEQFKYHDYYVICLFPALALNWLALSDAIQKIRTPLRWVKIVVLAGILLALNFQFNTGRKNLSERFTEGNYWDQSLHKASDLDSFRLQIRSLGIDRHDCVVAGYDPTPNNMLYLLHLRGHRLSREHNNERIEWILSGARPRYLISNDSMLSDQISRMTERMTLKASFKNLHLFELDYSSAKP